MRSLQAAGSLQLNGGRGPLTSILFANDFPEGSALHLRNFINVGQFKLVRDFYEMRKCIGDKPNLAIAFWVFVRLHFFLNTCGLFGGQAFEFAPDVMWRQPFTQMIGYLQDTPEMGHAPIPS